MTRRTISLHLTPCEIAAYLAREDEGDDLFMDIESGRLHRGSGLVLRNLRHAIGGNVRQRALLRSPRQEDRECLCGELRADPAGCDTNLVILDLFARLDVGRVILFDPQPVDRTYLLDEVLDHLESADEYERCARGLAAVQSLGATAAWVRECVGVRRWEETERELYHRSVHAWARRHDLDVRLDAPASPDAAPPWPPIRWAVESS